MKTAPFLCLQDLHLQGLMVPDHIVVASYVFIQERSDNICYVVKSSLLFDSNDDFHILPSKKIWFIKHMESLSSSVGLPQQEETLLEYFRHADFEELMQVQLVCKTWQRVSSNPNIWEQFAYKNGFVLEGYLKNEYKFAVISGLRGYCNAARSFIMRITVLPKTEGIPPINYNFPSKLGFANKKIECDKQIASWSKLIPQEKLQKLFSSTLLAYVQMAPLDCMISTVQFHLKAGCVIDEKIVGSSLSPEFTNVHDQERLKQSMAPFNSVPVNPDCYTKYLDIFKQVNFFRNYLFSLYTRPSAAEVYLACEQFAYHTEWLRVGYILMSIPEKEQEKAITENAQLVINLVLPDFLAKKIQNLEEIDYHNLLETAKNPRGEVRGNSAVQSLKRLLDAAVVSAIKECRARSEFPVDNTFQLAIKESRKQFSAENVYSMCLKSALDAWYVVGSELEKMWNQHKDVLRPLMANSENKNVTYNAFMAEKMAAAGKNMEIKIDFPFHLQDVIRSLYEDEYQKLFAMAKTCINAAQIKNFPYLNYIKHLAPKSFTNALEQCRNF